MEKTLFLINLIIFSALSQLTSSQCPAQLDLQGFEAGVFQLSDLNNNDPLASTDIISFKQYSVALKNPLKDAKILVALAEISAQNSGIDLFDINIISKTQSDFTLGFIYQPAKWTKVSYRYLINNRTDLYFQMITLNSAVFKYIDKQSIEAQAELDHQLANFQNYEVLSFVRGLKYKNNELIDHSFSVSIVQSTLKLDKIVFSISSELNTQKVELELLSVSYLYFQPQKAEFASFGGLISKSNYVGINKYDILHADLPTNLYVLFGLTSINVDSKKFQVKAHVDQDIFFNLETNATFSKIDYTYFVVALKAARVCQKCEGLKIISGNSCVKECQNNQIYYEFKDQTKACQVCPAGQVPDQQRKQCISIKPSTEVKPSQSNQKKSVVQYQEQESYIPVKKDSNSGSTSTKQQMKSTTQESSIKGSPNSNTQISSQISTENYIPSQNPSLTTLILSGPIQSQTQAQQPTLNEFLTQAPQTPIQTSVQYNQQQFKQFEYCGTLSNSYWTGESCQCKVGFKMSMNRCVSMIEQMGQYLTNYTQQELHSDNGEINVQTIDQQYNPTMNTPPSIPSNSRPLTLGAPLHYQKPQKNTPFKCPTDLEIYNVQTSSCECSDDLSYFTDPQTNKTVCIDCAELQEFYEEKGWCKECPSNMFFDKETEECTCREGYEKDELGICIKVEKKQAISPIATPLANDTNQNNSSTTANGTNSQAVPPKPTPIPPSQVPSSTQKVPSVPVIVQTVEQKPLTQTAQKIETLTSPSSNQSSSTSTQTVSTTVANTSTTANSSIQTASQTSTVSPSVNSSTQTPMNTSTSSPTPSSATLPSDCMKLSAQPQINAANVFISIQLSTEKTFRSEDQMQNFIKKEFSTDQSKPAAVYCNQNESNLKIFECLMLYPPGVPNANFEVKFWYADENNAKCELKVQVNPLEIANRSIRSLRRR